MTFAIHGLPVARGIAIGRAVRSSPMALPYVSGGRGELTMLWRLEITNAGAGLLARDRA